MKVPLHFSGPLSNLCKFFLQTSYLLCLMLHVSRKGDILLRISSVDVRNSCSKVCFKVLSKAIRDASILSAKREMIFFRERINRDPEAAIKVLTVPSIAPGNSPPE